MKKVLVISYQCLSSPKEKKGLGGSLYSMIRAQSSYTIDFLYFGEKDHESEISTSSFYNKIMHIDIRKKESLFKKIVYFIFGKPYLSARYKYNKIKDLSFDTDYDYIVFDSFSSILAYKYFNTEKKVAFMIDSMPLHYERRSKRENLVKRVYDFFQKKFIIKTEKKVFKYFDRIAYVSEIDTNYEKSIHKSIENRFFTIINGIFLNDIELSPIKDLKNKTLMFSGIMSYKPNQDAVDFFMSEIYPQLIEKHPNLIIYFVGKNEEYIKKYSTFKNVIITGMVDSVYSYMKGCTIYISPLMYGTGMKNKILEAMGSKCAIIASSVSVEGINELQNNTNYLLANSKDEWLIAIDNLLNNENKRIEFGNRCYEIVKENYCWDRKLVDLIGD